MRRGHCKRLARTHGREFTRGRATFARSVNKGHQRWHAMDTKHKQKDRLAWQATDLEGTLSIYWASSNCLQEAVVSTAEEVGMNKTRKHQATRWCEALARAEEAAVAYEAKLLQQRIAKLKIQQDNKKQKVKKQLDPLHALRRCFWSKHGMSIQQHLECVFNTKVNFNEAPVSRKVQHRFLNFCNDACGQNVELVPAFHGTKASNHISIFEHGLLVPGKGNNVKVAHGAVHGVGIYTTKLGSALTSRGFCSEAKMLVCGLLDDLDDKEVKHAGGVMIIFEELRVIPLYEACACETRQATRVTVPSAGTAATKRAPELLIAKKTKISGQKSTFASK